MPQALLLAVFLLLQEDSIPAAPKGFGFRRRLKRDRVSLLDYFN